MQLRYLGDSHDFIKFALLRHLHDTLNVTLGVNWYLTCPKDVDRPNNQDGEQRHHMNGDEWREWKEKLFDEFTNFQELGSRSFGHFRKSSILPPDTLYYEEQLKTTGDRSLWHKEAITALPGADLIFLDPDNGFQVPSWTKRTRPKYATYAEACAYLGCGKIVVGIQFARQCNPVVRGSEIGNELVRRASCSSKLPILRGRITPNILFLTLCPSKRIEEVRVALESFAQGSPLFKDKKTKKDARRVEVIPKPQSPL
jgi:hypothetical protein